MPKHIAIYGGSFDPPHLGHIGVARHILKKSTLIDQLWVVPVGKHPWGACVASSRDRFNMISCAMENVPGTYISDIEISKEKTSYTIDTIDYFYKKYPHKTWYMVVGADSAQTIYKWKNYNKLITLTRLIVVSRKNFSLPKNLPKDTIIIKDEKKTIPDITSTEIREAVQRGDFFDALTHQCVAEYIKTHKLYL